MNKKIVLKKFVFILCALMTLIFVSVYLLTYRFAPQKVGVSPTLQCEVGGGTWQMHSSGCKDDCGARNYCTDAFTEGCGCGQGKCWNGFFCQAEQKKYK